MTTQRINSPKNQNDSQVLYSSYYTSRTSGLRKEVIISLSVTASLLLVLAITVLTVVLRLKMQQQKFMPSKDRKRRATEANGRSSNRKSDDHISGRTNASSMRSSNRSAKSIGSERQAKSIGSERQAKSIGSEQHVSDQRSRDRIRIENENTSVSSSNCHRPSSSCRGGAAMRHGSITCSSYPRRASTSSSRRCRSVN